MDTRNVSIAYEHAERVADWLLSIEDPDERERVQEIYERKLNDRLYRGSLDMQAAKDAHLADVVGLPVKGARIPTSTEIGEQTVEAIKSIAAAAAGVYPTEASGG